MKKTIWRCWVQFWACNFGTRLSQHAVAKSKPFKRKTSFNFVDEPARMETLSCLLSERKQPVTTRIFAKTSSRKRWTLEKVCAVVQKIKDSEKGRKALWESTNQQWEPIISHRIGLNFSESLRSASSCFARPPHARHPRVCVQLVVSCDVSGFLLWGLWVVILARSVIRNSSHEVVQLHSASPASHGIPNLDVNPDVGSVRAMVTFQLLGGNLPRSTCNFMPDFRPTRTQDPPRICLERLCGYCIQSRHWH